MKIEKISDTQIKVFLNQSDLKERNIKLSELAYGSEKTQALFREMMEKAVASCGFEIQNTPLMIEAIPVSSDSIMIIVSKVSESTEIEKKFNLLPEAKEARKFKKAIITEKASDIEIYDFTNSNTKVSIFSFNTLDDASSASSRLINICNTVSSLYKYNKRFFLVIETERDDTKKSNALELTLSEYGERHTSNLVSKYFLDEHAEKLIKNNAVEILSAYV